MNRTFSVPKSVLRYVLDKGQYFDPETSFIFQCLDESVLIYFQNIVVSVTMI